MKTLRLIGFILGTSGLIFVAIIFAIKAPSNNLTPKKIDVSLPLDVPAQLHNTEALGQGQLLFINSCAECHANQGQGNKKGPNLTDAYWIHGKGSFNELTSIIQNGIPGKMPAWKQTLQQDDIEKIAAYIVAIRGSKPPYPKAPEGTFQHQ